MTKWHDRSPRDIEVHFLNNRLGQQRYRARKCDEKFRGLGNKPLLPDLFISSFPRVTNGFCLTEHDLNSLSSNINTGDATGLTELAQDNIGKCDIEAGLLQATCIPEQEGMQQTEGHQCVVRLCGNDAIIDPYMSLRDNFTSNKIQQSLLELQPGCVNNLQMDHDPAAKPLDQKEQGRLLARRLKNRERQRRYRARKRLEADMNKTHFVHNSNSLTLDLQPNGKTVNHVNSVYCQRKWKKDARRAHAPKEPNLTSTTFQSLTSTNLQPPVVEFASEQLAHIPTLEVKVEQPAEPENLVVLNYCETNENSHVRRDWKEDARCKVD